jgi:hypothetical protein
MILCNPDSNFVAMMQVMRRKEKDYTVVDYLNTELRCDEAIDEDCRAKMVDWSVQIVDYCGFKRETVAISMNMLDRFVRETPLALVDRSIFQLASISCLYSAIKINEPKAISSETMATLSRYQFDRNQIEAMEQLILKTVKWLCHPPTTFAFGHYYCKLVAGSDTSFDFDTLWEMTKVQLESVLNNYQMALVPSSSVAFAAVVNAIENIPSVPYHTQQEMERLVASVANVDSHSAPIKAICRQLYENIAGGSCATYEKQGSKNRVLSPRTVSSIRAPAKH